MKRSYIEPDEVSTLSEINQLSQSEIHLKVILGKDYEEDNIEENVRRYLTNYTENTEENRQFLMQECIKLIQCEKKWPQRIFYYHGVDNAVGFIYDVYTALYQVLQINDQWKALRYHNSHLQEFNNIIEFIAFYSDNGKKKIHNNQENYNDYAISTNVFLFGNHLTPSSNSIFYMLNNLTSRDIDIKIMLENIFKYFDIKNVELERLLSLYQEYASLMGGRLY